MNFLVVRWPLLGITKVDFTGISWNCNPDFFEATSFSSRTCDIGFNIPPNILYERDQAHQTQIKIDEVKTSSRMKMGEEGRK